VQKARPLLTHPAAQQAPVNLAGGAEAEAGMGKQVRAKLRRAFVAFDTDGSGSISLAELEAAFRQCGIFVPDDALKRMFRDADVDRSGAIELAEFEALARRHGLQTATLCVLQAAGCSPMCATSCNPVRSSLQPHAATACVAGCSRRPRRAPPSLAPAMVAPQPRSSRRSRRVRPG